MSADQITLMSSRSDVPAENTQPQYPKWMSLLNHNQVPASLEKFTSCSFSQKPCLCDNSTSVH